MKWTGSLQLVCAMALLTGCGDGGGHKSEVASRPDPAKPSYFKADPKTAGVLEGAVRFTGRKPPRRAIDMSGDPACAEANHNKAYDEPVAVNADGTLANVFVYIKGGLEGKPFEPPPSPVTIDQQGCGFHPRVLGIQTGQTLLVTNSDAVTHNIHPLAQINREWNHSQGSGDAPLSRKFLKPEVMIPVKCNIHSWMHAYIGAVEHPYFGVTGATGAFKMQGVPPGDYVIEAWHETLGTQQQKVTLTPSGKVEINFTFKGESR